MQNLPQGSEIWIAAGVAFILGFLVEWLIARSRRGALVQEYESQVQSAQRTLKRTQDDLATVQSQLDAQRDRAEQLSAEKATVQGNLELAEESLAGETERASGLEEALGQEIERREAVEELLEQIRTQAMELQTSLDASQSELGDMGVRVEEEIEARQAAETALEAEAMRVSELAGELESLSGDLAAARMEMEAVVAIQQAAGRMEALDVEPPDAPVQRTVSWDAPAGEEALQAADSGESVEDAAVENGEPVDEVSEEDAALESAQVRVSELSVSVNALAAMGAELALELEKREQENRALRAQLTALAVEPDLTSERTAYEQAIDREAQLAALQGELSAARAQNAELEQQLAEYRREMEQAEQAVAEQAEKLAADAAVAVGSYQQKEAELADATARAGELEAQLAAQTDASAALESELAAAQQEAESLSAQLRQLQSERDALASQNTGMRARLQDRTEEVSALTSATVAAAATIKRRDEALRRAEALAESLRAQAAEAETAKQAVEAALTEKSAAVVQEQGALDALKAEIAALGESKSEAEAKLSEKDVALAEALSEKQTAVEQMEATARDLRKEVEVARAQLASREERLVRLTALVQSVTAGETAVGRSPSKEAAVRNALSIGVPPGELFQPQDFNPLTGIGPAYEQRLYAAGIGTYWELASISDEDLLQALGLERAQQLRVEPSAIRAEAYRFAEKTGTLGVVWEGRRVDDFESLEGVGETYEQRLYAAGIYTYEDLARATVKALSEVIETGRHGKPDFARWIEQARERLATRGQTG